MKKHEAHVGHIAGIPTRKAYKKPWVGIGATVWKHIRHIDYVASVPIFKIKLENEAALATGAKAPKHIRHIGHVTSIKILRVLNICSTL